MLTPEGLLLVGCDDGYLYAIREATEVPDASVDASLPDAGLVGAATEGAGAAAEAEAPAEPGAEAPTEPGAAAAPESGAEAPIEPEAAAAPAEP